MLGACNPESCSGPTFHLDGARLREIWEGSYCITSSYLAPLLTRFLLFFGSLPTAGCLPLGCIPIHCTSVICGWRCCFLVASRCDLRDPGWGDPGFRHCRSVVLFCTFAVILRWCLVGCVIAFGKISLIHRHISCHLWQSTSIERGASCFLLFWLVLFGFFCLFSVVLFAGLFPRWSPLFGQLGLRTGPRFLSTPQSGNIQDFAQFVQWHKHCVTTWREPRRRRTEKKSQSQSNDRRPYARNNHREQWRYPRWLTYACRVAAGDRWSCQAILCTPVLNNSGHARHAESLWPSEKLSGSQPGRITMVPLFGVESTWKLDLATTYDSYGRSVNLP